MSALASIQNELPKDCRILAVSKLQPVSKIRALLEQGQRAFGENYVQEARQKQTELAEAALEWHFIGNLQKNKAKDVVGRFDLIHSVDSLSLAEALDRRHDGTSAPQRILIQLNLAGEESKGGFSRNEFETAFEALIKLRRLEVAGLMTMPPLFENPEEARPYFKKLRELRDDFVRSHPALKELSMGTSSDYRVAADEGATWVRLGTVLFGERP